MDQHLLAATPASVSTQEAPPPETATPPETSARVTPEQLQAAANVMARAVGGESEPTNSFGLEYDELRSKLRALWEAPVRDFVAIDDVMGQLDQAHAAFKAQHRRGDDSQRY